MVPFLLNQCGSVVYYLTLASVGNNQQASNVYGIHYIKKVVTCKVMHSEHVN